MKVQGEGAAQEIAQAIYDFNRYQLADVLIVGRGGGSIEDLWAFNEEIVAKAIFESHIPIIAAIGHETDFTIADWVADVRAPTPSAAAEIAIAEKANLLKFLASLESLTHQRILQQIQSAKQKLSSLQKHPLFSSPYATLSPYIQRIDLFQSDIEAACRLHLQQKKQSLESFAKQLHILAPSQKITAWKTQLQSQQQRLQTTLAQILNQKKERLNRLIEHLRSINPQNLLKKGYSILFSETDQTLILSANQLTSKQTIRALLHDGQITATVETINHDTRKALL